MLFTRSLRSQRRFTARFAVVLSLGFLPFLQSASPQTKPGDSVPAASESGGDLQQKAEAALDRIERDDVGTGIVDATYNIELAAHVARSRAIPVLEAFFVRSHEQEIQNEVASVLVSLGDTDPLYWNGILHEARIALAHSSPDPFGMNADGSPAAPCASTGFIEWAKKHNVSPEKACTQAIHAVDYLRPLADTGDPRAVPILQEALRTNNFMFQAIAIQGLVLTQDTKSVPLIIETIRRAPQFQARHLADALIESNDPRAESVAHQYMPDVDLAGAKRFRYQRREWRRPLLTRK